MLSHLSLCQLMILLLSVKISTVSCDTFYIVTSPSSPCPGEYIGVPCLTLQQYASNPSQSQNITLLIEPETYHLVTVLAVSDGYNFTMSSTNATVMCTTATAKFEFNRVENIYISGMTFEGCRNGAAVQMTTVTQAVIVGSNFIRSGAAAVQMTRVTMVIVLRSNLSENRGNSLQVSNSESVTVNDSNFSENQGSCLYASYSLVTINGNRFYNNGRANSYTGRAISVSYSMIMINKSLFSNNVAYYANGGAISAYNSNITVDSSEFANNSAYYRSGGAIYVDNRNGDYELRINDTVLCGNRAYRGSGGAIYVYIYIYYWNRYEIIRYNHHLQIQNTVINNNRANQGGAV